MGLCYFISSYPLSEVATMVGFWEKSQKSDQMPYFGQNLVGFLSLQRNLEEFSRNSEIYNMIMYNISISTLNIAAF